MNYNHVTLVGLGILGMLLHNLKELNILNKAQKGNVNINNYLKLEKFSILLNIILVITCCIISQEIQQLKQVGNWLGFGFVAIGYMGQSLLVFFMGKASKIIGKEDEENKNDAKPTQ